MGQTISTESATNARNSIVNASPVLEHGFSKTDDHRYFIGTRTGPQSRHYAETEKSSALCDYIG
jgi:hypothetical protein